MLLADVGNSRIKSVSYTHLFRLTDALRPGAAAMVAALQARGLKVALLSGDRPEAVAYVAREVGIAEAAGGMTPQDLSLIHIYRSYGVFIEESYLGYGNRQNPPAADAAPHFDKGGRGILG